MITAGETQGGKRAQDFELNLAPIIDCFTVLIAYLLVSASFISLAVLETGVAARNGASAPGAGAAPEMEVSLAASGEIRLRLANAGPRAAPLPVPAKDGGRWDLTRLAGAVDRLKRDLPRLTEVTVSADPTVPYKDLVRAIEVLKRLLPKVYVAG